MGSSDDVGLEERFLVEAAARDLLDPAEGQALLAEARREGRSFQSLLIERGIMTARTIEGVDRATRTPAPWRSSAADEAQTLPPPSSAARPIAPTEARTDVVAPPSEAATLVPPSSGAPPSGARAAADTPGPLPSYLEPRAGTLAPLASSQATVIDDGKPTVLGDFELGERLGEGGMGTVHRATQRSLRREVAVKVLSARVQGDPQASERFLREARVAALVNHPNVITIFAVGEEAGRLFMAMELVKGGDASQLAQREGGRLPERRALEIIRDGCRGLGAIERAGLVHRDIKPSNLFIMEDGAAKLADLGLARPTGQDERMTQSGFVVGTPAYMPPEQAGGEEIDVRADIYALGASLYELVTGRPPFTGSAMAVLKQVLTQPTPDPRLACPALSAACHDVVMRSMDRDPRRRYQTAAEMLAGIEAALAGKLRPRTPPRAAAEPAPKAAAPRTDRIAAPSATTVTPARVEPSGSRPGPGLIVAGAGALAALALGIAAPFIRSAPRTPPAPTPTVEPEPAPSGPTPAPAPTPAEARPVEPVAEGMGLDAGMLDLVAGLESERPMVPIELRAAAGATAGWWTPAEGGGIRVTPGAPGGKVELVATPTPLATRLTFTCRSIELLANRRSGAASVAERQLGLPQGAPAFVYHLGVRKDGEPIGVGHGGQSMPGLAGIRGSALWVSLYLEKGAALRGLLFQSNDAKPAGELVAEGSKRTSGVQLLETFRVHRFSPGHDDLVVRYTLVRHGWRVSVGVGDREEWGHARGWTNALEAPITTGLDAAWTPFGIVGNHEDGRGAGALAIAGDPIRPGERVDLSPPRREELEGQDLGPGSPSTSRPRPAPTTATQPAQQQPPPPQPPPPQQQPPPGGRPPPPPPGGGGPSRGGPPPRR